MEYEVKWVNTRFTVQIIEEARRKYLSMIGLDENTQANIARITKGHETWKFDSISEFYAEYESSDSGQLYYYQPKTESQFSFSYAKELFASKNKVEIEIKLQQKADIHSIMNIFKQDLRACYVAPPTPPPPPEKPLKVFLGHGRDKQWIRLKDHLHDKQGYDVVAYETGTRAGFTIKEVLDSLLDESGIAFLIMTGENKDAQERIHARENVIHEIGLFQGKLGFDRAIILKENRVEEFSNIHGINQIRFPKGKIEVTYGDVIATIKREFPDD